MTRQEELIDGLVKLGSRLRVDDMKLLADVAMELEEAAMSRKFEDPSLQGIRTLEVWANQDERRHFRIVWEGPRRAVGNTGWTGGYKVAVWTGKLNRATFHLGRTLQDAALEATRAAE